MNRLKGRRPSPALLISMIALVLALGGTAIAAFEPTKSNVKKIAKKQANKAIKKKASSLSVAKAENATNATNATNAANAANAGNAGTVDGQSVQKVFARVAVAATNVVVATNGPLTIEADCTGSNVENLEVRSSVGDVAMVSQGNGNTGPTSDEEQGGGATPRVLDLDADGTNDNDRGMATFSVARADGSVWTGAIGFDDPNIFNGESTCAVFGHITSSG